jgi:uncharacterized RDD family membrane protein YckC
VTSREIRLERIRSLQGERAGFVSRVLATAIDIAMLVLIGFLILGFVAVIRWVTTSAGLHLVRPADPWSAVLVVALSVVYFGYFWGTTGRTVGEQFFGLRTLTMTGARISGGVAFARAVLTTLFPIGVLWVLLSRQNASVQDLICRTAVVYDWRYHVPDT